MNWIFLSHARNEGTYNYEKQDLFFFFSVRSMIESFINIRNSIQSKAKSQDRGFNCSSKWTKENPKKRLHQDRLCIHKPLIFLKQPTSTLKNHLRMGLKLLEIKFIPCVQDCPRTTHFSNSCWHSLICICWNRRKKSVAILRHFCVLPLNIAHSFRANEHSHNMTYCFGRLTAKLAHI